MICFRNRTFCSAACLCTHCDVRLDEAVRPAAAAWWGPAPLLIADRSAGCPNLVPDARA